MHTKKSLKLRKKEASLSEKIAKLEKEKYQISEQINIEEAEDPLTS